ncbi:hypothetical protein evm_000866 [Chilo suppressalis]|nr:hypothetical protein evm_000866 [Chilo suppressalis]
MSSPAQASEPRVVCYYTNWSVYRPGTARFNPQNINPYLCTHLIYAFGGFTKDNTLKPFDKYQDIEKGGYAKFTGLKTYNKKLKTMLAIGGWNEGSTRFSPMVAAKDRRKEFVRNAIKFLRQNHFDGLDLDWEYPAFRDGGKPKDRENYSKLVKELREEFEREAEKTGKPRLLLTMAVPAGIEYIQKGFDVRTLNQYLDWMNLLTYDYHSAFEPAVNHHAPLYPLEEPNEYSVDTELNIDYTIKFYLENGADPDKLVLGIPTYGRSYTLFNPDAVEIGSPADGPGEQGDATREKGYLAYYEICEALKPKNKKRSVDDDEQSEEDSEEEDEEWTVMHPNPKAMGPVAFRGNQWVGYDDIDIVRRKAEYVAENGLGGIMFWSIDNDDFRGNCHNKPYPLIEAAKEAYIAGLGATDNAIERASPAPRAPPRRRPRPRTRASTTTTTTTTETPATAARKSNKRKGSAVTSTTPSWNIITPEPPTTPDPGSDFKCTDEGFFPHPRDCKKYFWCLDSGPSNLGIVAHQFTCPSGLFFNKAADSCDFARNVLCKKPAATTKPTTAKSTTSTTTTTTTTTPAPTRRPIKISTRNSLLFRTTTTTTTTTPEPESEEEYEDEALEDATDIEAEDPKVIKELIDLIRKVGGVEQLEKHLHLSENSASTDGAVTTTQSPFNKKLYQKVLERTRGKSKFSNSISDGTSQNSRRGPQNAGLEATDDRDIFVKKDRPQYTTINRSRPSSTTEDPLANEEDDDEFEEPPQFLSRARAVESEPSVATTARPLQYVNIRRARPTTISTSDTADDTASRNALFERVEPYVSIRESPNSLDIASARRENMPEYVTIRRQRPTTEETTTAQYEHTELGTDSQDTALEKEISSQPQYTSIVRARSTTLPSVEEPSSPEPTTVLAVQISSLLNSPDDDELETPEPETPQATETEATTTTSTTTTTTTTSTTTAAPITASTRRAILRRRGSTTTSTTTIPPSTTQVSSRNYTFVRRRRPLSNRNEISPDLVDTDENLRKIRSTTPDSTEVDGIKNIINLQSRQRFRISTLNDDSVPAAAAPVARGQFRPTLSRDEIISLTPADSDTPQFVPRQNFAQRTVSERRFRGRTSTTVADNIEDSEVSAATVEVRRPNIIPRGRSRFTLSTTETPKESIGSAAITRRPTFSRFTPRPFARQGSTSTTIKEDLIDEEVTLRASQRLPFVRPKFPNQLQGRKVPFIPRVSTTEQILTNDENVDDDIENKQDDIALSESAIEEKEHDEDNSEEKEEEKGEEKEDEKAEENVTEIPKRRVVIKKIRPPSSTTENIITTETLPSDDSGRRKLRIIRRRPTSTTEADLSFSSTEADLSFSSTEATTLPSPKIRRIIRKKIRPVEDEPQPNIVAKSIGSLNAISKNSVTTENLVNYGEKTRKTLLPSSTTTEEPSTSSSVLPLTEKLEVTKTVDVSETPQESLDNVSQKDESDLNISTYDKPESNSTPDKISDSEKALTDLDSTNNNDETKEIESPQVLIENQKSLDLSENKEPVTDVPVTESEGAHIETTTQQTSSTSRARLPYRPPKRIFTTTTESSLPFSSRVFSRKYNPGVYTSPSTAEKSDSLGPVTRRPLFNSKPFTRRPFTPFRTTKKVEEELEEEYSDEEILDEEPENPFVFVPQSQLFTRKPSNTAEEDEEEYDAEPDAEEVDNEEEEPEEVIPPNRYTTTSRKPIFKPRVVNSNTFRASVSTTELPKRQFNSIQNRTAIFNRFGGNKQVNDTKKRVQNVPLGYVAPISTDSKLNSSINKAEIPTTVISSLKDENEQFTTTDLTFGTESDDDDYLSMTESTSTLSESTNTSDDITSTNNINNESTTFDMDVDTSTDEYLEYTEGTTSNPSTQDTTINSQIETEIETEGSTDATTISLPETTTTQPTVMPIFKTQFDKLFSVSRVVEVSSKLDKHRLNKNNETTLIEEGKIMVEKKPMIDKIGEVSRFSLIKIVEDEIPLYLTKLGHVYPVENPPENLIRIDEARNARALRNFADAPRENLVASESINEAYRHVKNSNQDQEIGNKSQVEHLINDDFLSYINEENKSEKPTETPLSSTDTSYKSEWQFVPAAYEKEQNYQDRVAKSFEIVTPRNMLTDPSTLPLESLFKTENPIIGRKSGHNQEKQPFVVYSASVPTPNEEANIVKLEVSKPEIGRNIITFAKGQEFQGGSIADETTIKYPVSMSVIPLSSTPSISTTRSTPSTTTTTTENIATSPIIDILTTTQATTITTETPSTTEVPSTTETIPEETTTPKISPLDAKRSKFAFPRRPIIKTNFTRPIPRPVNKINATVINNLNQKVNKTTSTGFNPSKSRFTATRSQNVPVDTRKKTTNITRVPSFKPASKIFSTEAPRTTTERKLFVKPIRPSFRPAFVPRRTTLAPETTLDT